MTQATATLAEFLLARITEDREAALTASTRHVDGPWLTAWSTDVEGIESEGWNHLDRWSPARVLAECEAKRRIVEAHPLIPAASIWGDPTGGLACEVCDERTDLTCGGFEHERSDGCVTLRQLALPYAEHPSYDESWRP